MLETPVPAEDDDSSKDIDESEQGADEELCIIPDTERVISQVCVIVATLFFLPQCGMVLLTYNMLTQF